jgi:hypothetical protein
LFGATAKQLQIGLDMLRREGHKVHYDIEGHIRQEPASRFFIANIAL